MRIRPGWTRANQASLHQDAPPLLVGETSPGVNFTHLKNNQPDEVRSPLQTGLGCPYLICWYNKLSTRNTLTRSRCSPKSVWESSQVSKSPLQSVSLAQTLTLPYFMHLEMWGWLAGKLGDYYPFNKFIHSMLWGELWCRWYLWEIISCSVKSLNWDAADTCRSHESL